MWVPMTLPILRSFLEVAPDFLNADLNLAPPSAFMGNTTLVLSVAILNFSAPPASGVPLKAPATGVVLVNCLTCGPMIGLTFASVMPIISPNRNGRNFIQFIGSVPPISDSLVFTLAFLVAWTIVLRDVIYRLFEKLATCPKIECGFRGNDSTNFSIVGLDVIRFMYILRFSTLKVECYHNTKNPII